MLKIINQKEEELLHTKQTKTQLKKQKEFILLKKIN
jgi:hypothetical protein